MRVRQWHLLVAMLVGWLLAALLILFAETAQAQQLGRRIPDIFFGSRSWQGCSSIIFDGTDLPMSSASGRCTVNLGSQVFEGGNCIGSAVDQGNGNDFCQTVTLATRDVDASTADQWKGRLCPKKPDTSICTADGDCSSYAGTQKCLAGRCVDATSGSECWHDGIITTVVGDGTSYPNMMQRGLAVIRLGGDGSDGAFTYAGEATANCTGSVCNGGTCTNNTPPGNTCTLTLNSLIGRFGGNVASFNASAGNAGVFRNYTTFTLTAGTLTVGTALTDSVVGNPGVPLIIKATGQVTMSGGTLDLKGKGSSGATAGTCSAAANPGKSGGQTFAALGGTPGGSGNNAAIGTGNAGTGTDPSIVLSALPSLAGTGGGACPASGQVSPGNITISPWGMGYGSTGGGGGGCTTSCSGTCGAGGAGGGWAQIESARGIALSGTLNIDVRGNDGTTGGGGGGGGGVRIVSPSNSSNLSTNTSTCSGTGLICTKAGAAGASPPTNCGAGAAGGNGVGLVQQTAPF